MRSQNDEHVALTIKVASDVEAYLAEGNTIQQIPNGASGETKLQAVSRGNGTDAKNWKSSKMLHPLADNGKTKRK